jgi:hypothetical protein
MRGKAVPEDLNFLQEMTQESYSATPKQDINGWILRKSTPNTKFWVKGNQAIVGVRGTKSSEDVSAWPTVPLNTLSTTAVYKKNLDAVREFKSEFPGLEMYGVGHSLGGAIIDGLIRDGLLKEAVSYNPAIQYKDINGGLPNRRIYYGSDPLYKLMGWWDRKSEHRPATASSWVDFLGNFSVPLAGLSALSSHKLSVFKGGMKGGGKFKDDFLKDAANIMKDILNRKVRFRFGDFNKFERVVVLEDRNQPPILMAVRNAIEIIMARGIVQMDKINEEELLFSSKAKIAELRGRKQTVATDRLDELKAYLYLHPELRVGPGPELPMFPPDLPPPVPQVPLFPRDRPEPPRPTPAPRPRPAPAPAPTPAPAPAPARPAGLTALRERAQALHDELMAMSVVEFKSRFGQTHTTARKRFSRVLLIIPNEDWSVDLFQDVMNKYIEVYGRAAFGEGKPRKNRKNVVFT